MKTIKTFTLVSVLVVGMTTSVFASWWNPFTWHWFKKDVSVTQQVPQNPVPSTPVVQNTQVSIVSSANKTATSTESKLKTYTDDNYGFSVKYNPDLIKTSVSSVGYMGKPNYSNTLFSLFYGAGSITFRGDRTTTYEDCLRNIVDTKNITPVVINGITFYKSIDGDAALGHFLNIDSYNTYYNGACYSVHVWIETDRTDGAPGYTDTSKEKSALQNILSTFTFITPQTNPTLHTSAQQLASKNEKEITERLNQFYYNEAIKNKDIANGAGHSLRIFYRDNNVIADWESNSKGGECLRIIDSAKYASLDVDNDRICSSTENVIETENYVIGVRPLEIRYYKKGDRSISTVQGSQLPVPSYNQELNSMTYQSYENGLDFTIPASFATATKILSVSLHAQSAYSGGDPKYIGNKKISEKTFKLP